MTDLVAIIGLLILLPYLTGTVLIRSAFLNNYTISKLKLNIYILLWPVLFVFIILKALFWGLTGKGVKFR